MRRLGLMLVVAALGALAIGVVRQPVGAAAATSCIKLNRIHYDSKGADTGSNASLNGEWIRVKSFCSGSRNLMGFEIRDGAGNSYTFGSFTLAAGATVKLRSGKGTNTPANRYWGRTNYVWGNTKDTARFYDASSSLVQTCSYNSSAVNAYGCPAGGYL